MSEETPVILARIEAKLDRVISDNADLEKRVRELEAESVRHASLLRWFWPVITAGGAGAASGLWSLFGGGP